MRRSILARRMSVFTFLMLFHSSVRARNTPMGESPRPKTLAVPDSGLTGAR
jgi:hypothetical protein